MREGGPGRDKTAEKRKFMRQKEKNPCYAIIHQLLPFPEILKGEHLTILQQIFWAARPQRHPPLMLQQEQQRLGEPRRASFVGLSKITGMSKVINYLLSD